MNQELFPQYSKTNDPEVLEALERNRIGRKEVLQRACEFSKLHGDTPEGSVFTSDWAGFAVTGIVSSEKPTSGRWKELLRSRNGWTPYKNNPLNEEMNSFQFREEKIPGIPGWIESASRSDGSNYVGNPKPFVLGETAYVGLSFMPITEALEDSPWEEIKASEFHKAMEDYNAKNRKGKQNED